jgi:hypothetical protein
MHILSSTREVCNAGACGMQLQIARIRQWEMGIPRGECDNLRDIPMVDEVVDSSDAVAIKNFLWNVSAPVKSTSN